MGYNDESYDVLDIIFMEDVDVEVYWQHDINVPEVGNGWFFLSDSE
jgi:hypothetical protein